MQIPEYSEFKKTITPEKMTEFIVTQNEKLHKMRESDPDAGTINEAAAISFDIVFFLLSEYHKWLMDYLNKD